MRAITDWYFTAHPPIMHDLHEAQPLMYTYSGGPPQNPNLDPILFAELPFFANWELAQMTKWGMPGVYTHAFMDGWSPGYLGSVAYNHNGMMRMYETQSGRDGGPPRRGAGTAGATGAAAAAGDGRGVRGWTGTARGGCWRGGCAATAVAALRRGGRGGGRGGAAAAKAPPARALARVPARSRQPARGGAAGRRRARARRSGRRLVAAGGRRRRRPGAAPCRPAAAAVRIASGIAAFRFRRARRRTSRAATTRTTCRRACSPACSSRRCSRISCSRTSTRRRRTRSSRAGRTAPYGYVIPVQRDMTKPAELVRILRLQGIEVGQTTAADQDRRRDVRRRART